MPSSSVALSYTANSAPQLHTLRKHPAARLHRRTRTTSTSLPGRSAPRYHCDCTTKESRPKPPSPTSQSTQAIYTDLGSAVLALSLCRAPLFPITKPASQFPPFQSLSGLIGKGGTPSPLPMPLPSLSSSSASSSACARFIASASLLWRL